MDIFAIDVLSQPNHRGNFTEAWLMKPKGQHALTCDLLILGSLQVATALAEC